MVSFDTTLFGPASTLFAIERAAHEAGYFIIIASLKALNRSSVTEAVDRLQLQSVDGILVIVSDAEAAQALIGAPFDLPLVAVEAGPVRGIPVVAVDQLAVRRRRRAISSSSGIAPSGRALRACS